MDIEGGFDQTDSKGFIRINAIRLMAHRAIIEASQKKYPGGFVWRIKLHFKKSYETLGKRDKSRTCNY